MAVINRESNYIFIHIYKTGGISIRNLLSESEIGGVHCSAEQVRSILVEAGDIDFWNNSFKFAVVRNPYDLVVSLYHHLHYYSNHIFHHIAQQPFENFVENLYHNHYQQTLLDEKWFFDNQFSWVSSNDKIIVDEVYRFENITSVFEQLSKRIGVENKNVHLNKSVTRPDINLRKSYNEKTVRMVNEMYAEDFDTFGYQRF